MIATEDSNGNNDVKLSAEIPHPAPDKPIAIEESNKSNAIEPSVQNEHPAPDKPIATDESNENNAIEPSGKNDHLPTTSSHNETRFPASALLSTRALVVPLRRAPLIHSIPRVRLDGLDAAGQQFLRQRQGPLRPSVPGRGRGVLARGKVPIGG